MKTRVLLVDDDEQVVENLDERLALRDYVVTTSFSGEDAIGKVRGFNFDVVVLDVKMPIVDGVEALREIKSARPLTEVIMLTVRIGYFFLNNPTICDADSPYESDHVASDDLYDDH